MKKDTSAIPKNPGLRIPLSWKLEGVKQRLSPNHLGSYLMQIATRWHFKPWKNWQIRWFIRRYKVNMNEVKIQEPTAYSNFNSFFTRELLPGSRPVDNTPDSLVAPADGKISAVGQVHGGALIQAKNQYYSVIKLLGGDPSLGKVFEGGSYMTIYLSPKDYHRVHMPIAGRLSTMIYVPGRLFSVNPVTTHVVREVFARNERVVSIFNTEIGPVSIILVGAVFVGNIEQIWSGVVTPPRRRKIKTWHYPESGGKQISLNKGGEMGRFNMGSTVIMIFPAGAAKWQFNHQTDSIIHMGEKIGYTQTSMKKLS